MKLKRASQPAVLRNASGIDGRAELVAQVLRGLPTDRPSPAPQEVLHLDSEALAVAYDLEDGMVARARIYFEIPVFLAQVEGV